MNSSNDETALYWFEKAVANMQHHRHPLLSVAEASLKRVKEKLTPAKQP
jgi:hypothetical protein